MASGLTSWKRILAAVIAVAYLSACADTIPKDALRLTQEGAAEKQLQQRRFDTYDEAKLLQASAALLQDLGFQIEESESKLGVLLGTKDRDATETGQVVGSILLALIFGVQVSIDAKQKIRASVVTRPRSNTDGSKDTVVRVTFQRIVWNTSGQISKLERLGEPELYQEFFQKLSQAVFLEAHEL